MSSSSGFTLIELSIVLVIVGLITGGLLFGQDLIVAAQVRGQLTQLERLKAATRTFEAKYDCIPGDCADAERFNLGTSVGPGANGNGNGQIFANPWVNGGASAAQMQEHMNFWYHLAKAGLIEGSYKGHTTESDYLTTGDGYMPKSKIGNKGWIFAFSTEYLHPTYPDDDVDFGNLFYLSTLAPPGPGDYDAFIPSIPVAMARALDRKIDDGLPYSGTVRPGSNYSGPMICTKGSFCDPAPSSWNGVYNNCVSGQDYQISSSKGLCIMAVGDAF